MKLAEFLKERDEMLLSLDVDKAIAFHKKWSPYVPAPQRDIAEIGMHKAITACKNLPMDARLASKRWLSERKYHSLDDGELTITMAQS